MKSTSEAVSSSSSSSSDQSQTATSSLKPQSLSAAAGGVEDLYLWPRDGSGGAQETVNVDRRGVYSALCRWTVNNFPRIRARALWSKYFEVGGYDCRLLVYPKGDSQALPGYISIYLQITDPRGTSSSKWDCFASYRLAIMNLLDDSKTIHRDSWHRFSKRNPMQYILEAQLQEEMSRHAPLCGAGLDALSMELETLARIHEEGLRQIHTLQQCEGSPAASPLVSAHSLPHSNGLYPTAPPPLAVGLPPSQIPNSIGIHSNRHVYVAVGPWFNHT